MPDDHRPAAPLAPDFAPHHAKVALVRAVPADGWLALSWDDGLTWRAYGMFLRENEVTPGVVNPVTREREVELDAMPLAAMPTEANITPAGDLAVIWQDGAVSQFSAAWLRDMAVGLWRPEAHLPDTAPWTTTDLPVPPSFDGPAFLNNADGMVAPLTDLWRYGLARLRGLPTDAGTVQRVAERIGTVRNSNFGFLFSVETKPDPDSNAYRAVPLDAHTDLATRELQPGFQLLHCRENSTTGGESTMVDGFAVADTIRADDPDAYRALTTLGWVFTNRHRDTDYRWSGPIIETDTTGAPVEIRNTGFLRFFPDMDEADIPRAYDALRHFTALCRTPRFQMATAFAPGDLVIFDNRRVLHGRAAFDPQSGVRRLEGCYLDRDEVASRLRVLARGRA
ncbi:MAG: TauD/TfdA family dioxygenase [Pseudomonadota bacterium]